MNLEKEDIQISNYTGLVETFYKLSITHDEYMYDHNATYILLLLSVDTYINVTPNMVLECGAKGNMSYFGTRGQSNTQTSLEYGILIEFPKQELDKYNCLQAGGQTRDLTGSLYGYAEYVEGRVTPVEHTVTSNTITYTAQEINEAFAVFGE